MADESDFLELLIASERVEAWLTLIRDGRSTSRVMQAVRELAAAVEAKEAYAEEARLAGAVAILTRLIKRTEDEQLLDMASDIIAACSGPMAVTDKIRTFYYEGTSVVIKEGALGDGVGAKIWTVAHTLCREMVAYPEIVREHNVLEIGSGCGACGILAAKLGASQVFLTDYLEAILTNLRACMHLNAATAGSCWASSGGGGGSSSDADAEFDPEDASECSDLDDFFSGTAAEPQAQQAQQQAWDVDNMHVRFLDWSESVAHLQQQGQQAQQQGQQAQQQGQQAQQQGQQAQQQGNAPGRLGSPGQGRSSCERVSAPGVGLEEQFSVILGTDILYEWPMVEMVACVLKHRLAPGGRALLCCAVREQAMFDALVARLRELGFRLGLTPVQPKMDDGGILGKERNYEGGFVMMAAEHADAPAASWHRDDLFSS